MRTNRLDRTTAWVNLQTTVTKTLEYPLPATTLTREECLYIMRPLCQAGLPAMGINRNLPTELVWGPLRAQGLGLHHLYVTQGIEHLKVLVTRGTLREDITGSLIRLSVEQMKVELGLSGSLFLHDPRPMATAMTPCWLSHTWGYMWEFGIRVVETTSQLEPLRTKDVFLMEAFVQNGYHGEPLRQLNCCRLYLRVTTLAEISTGDGRFITRAAWVGERVET